MPSMVLYDDYTREEVHHLFAPEVPFTPQSGTWGLQGIIVLPDRPGDFLFFVTFGQRQGDHVFDEGITNEGVLSWQSQTRQGFSHPQIQQFIHHDALTHTIYCSYERRRGVPIRTSGGSHIWRMMPSASTRSTSSGNSSIGRRLQPSSSAWTSSCTYPPRAQQTDLKQRRRRPMFPLAL
jgi:hypothetical protein